MSSSVLAVEVMPSELVAVDVDLDADGGLSRARHAPLGTDDGDRDPVDVLADAFACLVGNPSGPAAHDDSAPGTPTRLVIATPADTERRRFEEITEATALVGLPAPAWVPAPVALVGERISAEVRIDGQSVVLDARGGGITAWPVRRTASGAEIGSRGPVATGTRLDQLLLGVVRAQLSSLDAVDPAQEHPSPGSRATGRTRDLRGEAARLRREIRRARVRLASGEVAQTPVTVEGVEVVLERVVFDQLVEHALRETFGEITDGPEEAGRPPVHVLGDGRTPLAHRLAELVAEPERTADVLVLPGSSDDGALGLAALLAFPPARAATTGRTARAASGAQAIRAARVGHPRTPTGTPAVGAAGEAETAPEAGADTVDGPREVAEVPHTDPPARAAAAEPAPEPGPGTGETAPAAEGDTPPEPGTGTGETAPAAAGDTPPEPGPGAGERAGRAPRGAIPVLVVLLLLVVLAAVGVLLVGPAQIGTAFDGLGLGTGMLPAGPGH